MKTKYHGMKRASDWDFKRVYTTRKIANGMGSIPAGTKGTLGGHTRNGNIDFYADECRCCGAVFRVSGLEYGDFKLIDGSEYTLTKTDMANQWL